MTEQQTPKIWEKRIEAEVRSLYFADLTSRYALRKQIITGVSFFLSSASAASVVAKFPWYVPVALSVIVAGATAYSIANGVLSTTPTSQSSDVFNFPGSTPSISANGSSNGIVWDLDRSTNQP